MAIKRLQEALEEITSLESLNHRDLRFAAWREKLAELFHRNWPAERLANFWEQRISFGQGPLVTQQDVATYRRDLVRTKDQIERLLRNERELAEYNNSDLTELFLPSGSQHDAYQEIRRIVSAATKELIIVDNYVNTTLFKLLANSRSPIIRLLTYSMPVDFALEARAFIQQYGCTIEIRRDRTEFHDRFIIVDMATVFHLGHSIKDAGNKAMMIHRVEDQRNVQAALTVFGGTWGTAMPVQI